MLKSQWVIAAVALVIGAGLYETAGVASNNGATNGLGTGSGKPVSKENTGNSSDKVPPKPGDPGTVEQKKPTDTGYTPPAVPKHDVADQGDVRVDATALTKFAGNMDTLANTLAKSYTEVGGIPAVAAGAFPSAVKISKNVATLATESSAALNSMVIALRDLRDAMNKIATDYKHTEEASKMSADKLGKYTSDVTRATSAINSSTK